MAVKLGISKAPMNQRNDLHFSKSIKLYKLRLNIKKLIQLLSS